MQLIASCSLKKQRTPSRRVALRETKKNGRKNLVNGAAWYKHKHGHFPAQVADTPIEAVKEKA